MTRLPVTQEWRPPFAAICFNGGWAVIDANGDFPAAAIIDGGFTIPGHTEGDETWECTAEQGWCESAADALNAVASGE